MKRMKRVIEQVGAILKSFFKELFLGDTKLIDADISEILSNPEDAKKYRDGLEKVEQTKSSVTIRFSNDKEITLIY